MSFSNILNRIDCRYLRELLPNPMKHGVERMAGDEEQSVPYPADFSNACIRHGENPERLLKEGRLANAEHRYERSHGIAAGCSFGPPKFRIVRKHQHFQSGPNEQPIGSSHLHKQHAGSFSLNLTVTGRDRSGSRAWNK